MISFSLDLRATSWNTLARKSHWVYTQVFDEWKQATWAAIVENKIQPIKGPVDITVTAFFNDKRAHDSDNICIKPLLDQLVTDGILEGDHLDIVRSVTLKARRGSKTCLVVEIKAASI